MKRFIGVSLATVLTASTLAAQAGPPATDIYLVRLRGAGGGAISDPPVNLTQRAGYDNQPAFTADGRALLYTSIRDDGQADTYRLDLASRTSTRLTDTPESEYSPTPMPAGGGFSVVRVERDSAQRLWAFNAEGRAPVLLLPGIAPVGYHLWLDDHTLALFVLGSPNSLQIADTQLGTGRTIAHDIGRSLQRVPGSSRFSFLTARRFGLVPRNRRSRGAGRRAAAGREDAAAGRLRGLAVVDGTAHGRRDDRVPARPQRRGGLHLDADRGFQRGGAAQPVAAGAEPRRQLARRGRGAGEAIARSQAGALPRRWGPAQFGPGSASGAGPAGAGGEAGLADAAGGSGGRISA